MNEDILKEASKSSGRGISRRRNLLFKSIALVLPLAIVVSIELVFQLLSIDVVDPYINVTPVLVFEREKRDGIEYASISQQLGYAQHRVQFPVVKPENTFRIFCLGGSAAAGWPLAKQHVFSTYLEKLLQDKLPEYNVEVINASAHGFASYRVRLIFDEVLKLNPDVIVVYSGNNEFLERREYSTINFKGLGEFLSKLKLVRWMRHHIIPPKANLPGGNLVGAEEFFYSKVKREALDNRSNPEQFESVKRHYHHAMTYMANEGSKNSVPIIFCTVPVNLRDWQPVVSLNRLGGENLEYWQNLFHNSERYFLQGDYRSALTELEKAIDLEAEHAGAHFLKGRILDQLDPALAMDSYKLARDLDYNPFRAVSSFNNSIRQIVSSRSGVYLADLELVFEQDSDYGVPGFDLFEDYVHANTRGHLLVAESLLKTITEMGILSEQLRLSEVKENWVSLDEAGQIYNSQSDVDVQVKIYSLLLLHHQYSSSIQKIRQLHQLATGKSLSPGESLPQNAPDLLKEGYEVILNYEVAYDKWLLGEIENLKELNTAKRRLERFYEKWFPYGTF
jgi:tetratricopeptide (TPR) repeat protein